MALFTIMHRFTGAVLFERECGSLKLAVEVAVKHGADLTGANLTGAHLGSAHLGSADLTGADLAGADLAGADLTGAYLGSADLTGAHLGSADLTGAYLGSADLAGADLTGANLGGADLTGANLTGANLGGFKIDGEIGIIDAGMPNHWHAHGFVETEAQTLWVLVGCRNFEISEGREYWKSEAHPDRENRREVLLALDYIEAVARLRGWTGAAKKEG